MEHMMTTDEALDYYLELRTHDRRADLLAAGREAAKRRREGPAATTAILRGLHLELGLSYRQIEAGTALPIATISRLLTGATP